MFGTNTNPSLTFSHPLPLFSTLIALPYPHYAGLFGGGGATNTFGGGGAFGASQGSTFGTASSGSAFGGGGAFGAKPAGGMFGSTQSSTFGRTTASAFGGGGAGAFGAKPAGGFGASTGSSLFGGQSASAFGGGGAFGSTGGSSLFGSQARASNVGGASTGGLFGAASSASMFGGGSAFGASNAFGGGAASAGSLFGAKPAGAGLGWSGQQQQQQQLQMQQQQQLQAMGGGYGAPNPASDFQNAFLNIKNAYDPASTSNRFRMMLYNVVSPGDANRYVPNQLTDMTLWNQAKRNNPNPARLIPVQAIGFSDLKVRIAKQDEQTNAHKNALASIEETLRDVRQRHKLHTVVKAQEYRQKHFEFGQRLLKVMQQLTTLQAKGTLILSEEVSFRQKLEQLQQSMLQPNRMKIRELEGLVNIYCEAAPRRASAQLTPEASATVFEYLKDQTAAIKHLREITEKDERDMRYIDRNLEGSSKSPRPGKA
eukprot:TRINITY_DN40601_c0_g1_i1.p1 TRINITY_DN40601_c0_g1~~TRINITY_DN40601_c0_g1_i1.p1  ORF type:complete len:483 (+),score=115.89 TRINITY_DN40601_c0_g1_i1:224-1672(+)